MNKRYRIVNKGKGVLNIALENLEKLFFVDRTSDLINDGANGVDPFITASEVPQSVVNTSELNNDGENGTDPFITANEVINTVIGSTDSTTAENGVTPVEGDTTTLAVYNQHFQTLKGEGNNSETTIISLSDGFLATIPTNEKVEGTYSELKALRDADGLKEGQQYVMTDYQTKYIIQGSDSSGITKEKNISSVISGFAVLNNDYEYDLSIGQVVTITELPVGYSGGLTVGSTTTVSTQQQQYYFKFANGMQTIVGLKFSFSLPRYTNIAQDLEVLDANGKKVITPGGVLNTTVHDGQPYMDMSGTQNLAVPTERIVLTASTNGSFDLKAFSETFDGDVLEYDMDNIDVTDANGAIVGSRNGLVIRRANRLLGIDIGIDWRAARYRRWLPNSVSRTKFLNRDRNATTTRVGRSGVYLFTSRNKSESSLASFYIMKSPEETFMTIDDNAMKITYLSEVETISSAKDLTVFQLDSNYNPVSVIEAILPGTFFNTVFQGIGGEYNYELAVSTTGSMSNCTFVANPRINSENGNNEFDNVICLDSLTYSGSQCSFSTVNMLGYCFFSGFNVSSVSDTIIGVSNGLSPDAGSPATQVFWHTISGCVNTYIQDSVLGQATIPTFFTSVRLGLSSLFFYSAPLSTTEDSKFQRDKIDIIGSVFSRVGLRMTANLGRLSFTNMYFDRSRPSNPSGLFLYDVFTGQKFKNIQKNKFNDVLYYEEVDANNQIQLLTLATPI